MTNKISALIVCHNEEKVIERCLKSICEIVDEIIVIHDGLCSDETLKIANRYTDKVYEQKIHKGIGEAWYILGFKLCKNPWILRIDADEYLSRELQANLKLLVKNDCAAYSFYWPIWDGEKYLSTKAIRKNFLFRKSKIGFIDKFHYPIKVQGEICKSNLIVEHKPKYNNWSQETFNKKQINWAKLQAKDHIIPVEDREILNLTYSDLKKEQDLKTFFYKIPALTFLIAYLLYIKRILFNTSLMFDTGFWIVANYQARYSFEVAKEVNRLLNERKVNIDLNHQSFYHNNTNYSLFLENQKKDDYSKYTYYIKKYSDSKSLILDVGCGTGTAIALMINNRKNCKGIDISQTSISICLKKQLSCEVYDGIKIPFTNDNFDLVGSFNVLEHTNEPKDFLNENLRVLKKGGYLIVACPNFLSITNGYHVHTKGFVQKIKNIISIISMICCNDSGFKKMNITKNPVISPDDDAVNITNPISILKWSRMNNLHIIYWSSQSIFRQNILKWIDRSIIRYFLGSCFFVFKK